MVLFDTFTSSSFVTCCLLCVVAYSWHAVCYALLCVMRCGSFVTCCVLCLAAHSWFSVSDGGRGVVVSVDNLRVAARGEHLADIGSRTALVFGVLLWFLPTLRIYPRIRKTTLLKPRYFRGNRGNSSSKLGILLVLGSDWKTWTRRSMRKSRRRKLLRFGSLCIWCFGLGAGSSRWTSGRLLEWFRCSNKEWLFKMLVLGEKSWIRWKNEFLGRFWPFLRLFLGFLRRF